MVKPGLLILYANIEATLLKPTPLLKSGSDPEFFPLEVGMIFLLIL
jgi:hypothetical protein